MKTLERGEESLPRSFHSESLRLNLKEVKWADVDARSRRPCRSTGSATSSSMGAIIGVADFGAFAPGPVVMREFDFTPAHVVAAAKRVVDRNR